MPELISHLWASENVVNRPYVYSQHRQMERTRTHHTRAPTQCCIMCIPCCTAFVVCNTWIYSIHEIWQFSECKTLAKYLFAWIFIFIIWIWCLVSNEHLMRFSLCLFLLDVASFLCPLMDRIKGMTEYMIIFGKLTGLPGGNGDHLQRLSIHSLFVSLCGNNES